MPSEPTVTDQRLLRGARSRRAILRHAVDVASVEGLTGLSFGRLAADLAVSKSGVQTLFPTKDSLQLAVIDLAREVFHEAVIAPAQAAPPGAARVRALADRWIEYARAPLFPGGCFWAANVADFDSRPGPVRDVLRRQQKAWRRVIATELRHAVDAAEVATGLDPDLAAFQIDAVLVAANTALRFGDDAVVDQVHRVIDGLLSPPTTGAAAD